MNPYPTYKPVAVPWLQQVPEHWEMQRIKTLVREMESRSKEGKEVLMSLSKSKGLVPQTDLGGKAPSAKTHVGYKICEPEQIVMNRMQAWNGLFGLAKQRGMVSPDYAVFKVLGEQQPYFLQQLFRCPLVVEQFANDSKGIGTGFNRLYTDKFGAIAVPLAPPDEQQLIVRYLHALDVKVKRYIRTKRTLIARLQEQKQAIIQRAVTRGLDPNVKLKPSGVEWLGEVPVHWEVRRLASVASFQSGKAHENFIEPNGQYVCVNARFVSSEGESRKYCTQSFCTAVKGDVLMVMSDLPNGRALARAYLVEDDSLYAVNQRVCRLRAFAMNPKFLTYAANRNPGLMRHNDGFNQTHLSNSDYKTLPIVVPPLPEQDEIVRAVERQVARIDVSFKAIERELRMLNEYHTRLIADVVTGAVDVREAARELPAIDQPMSGSEDQIMEEEEAEGQEELTNE